MTSAPYQVDLTWSDGCGVPSGDLILPIGLPFTSEFSCIDHSILKLILPNYRHSLSQSLQFSFDSPLVYLF
jgi:hypothetical protein